MTDLKDYISQDVTTLTTCYKITKKTGEVVGLTNFDKDVLYNDILYISSISFNCKKISSLLTITNKDNIAFCALDNDLIMKKDLLNGKYDGAKVEIFIINYLNLSAGYINLFSGFFGSVECINNSFSVKLKPFNSILNATIGNYYIPTCRALFCDKKCGLNIADYSFYGNVANKISETKFYSDVNEIKSSDIGYFNNGYIEFIDGDNIGYKVEVSESNDGYIELIMPIKYDIKIGDNFIIYTGCDKKLCTCKNKFNNLINFRGEPYIPGIDYLLYSK